jgi:predicted RNA-binding protein (virulence factor B family)
LIEIGKKNNLKVKRQTEFGYFLDAETGATKDDILLHNRNLDNRKIEIGDEIEVFIYRDSQDRLAATLKDVLAEVGQVALLRVADNTDIGSFVDIGLEKDILVPFKEKKYHLLRDETYPFYIYLDKSGRIAATTDIDYHLETDSPYNIGDTVDGVVYGFQTNGSAMICVDSKFAGVILNNEYFSELRAGDKLKNLKIIKIYEDGKLGLTPRGERKEEMDIVEEKIISYLEGSDGTMRFNDKSDPEEIRIVFKTSKKNFKRALGSLMKKRIIGQDSEGTFLL